MNLPYFRSLTGIAALILFLGIPFSYSQNLIFNPGFEINYGIPDNTQQWYLADGWSNVHGGTHYPAPSPDYFHLLSNHMLVGLPHSGFGTVYPLDGEAVMGIVLWEQIGVDFREYLTQELTAPLVVGAEYEFSFYTTNGVDGFGYATSDLGVWFSVDPPSQINAHNPIAASPQFTTDSIIYSQDWIQITYSFVADAPYQHFTIGNFEDDQNTTLENVYPDHYPGVYHFFDNFSLIETKPVIHVYGPSTLCLGDTTTLTATRDEIIGWALESDPETFIGGSNSLFIRPSTTTTYLVYGELDTASWTVEVLPSPIINLGPDQTICPGNTVSLDASERGATYHWQDGSTESSFLAERPGNYWVEVNLDDCILIDSIQIQRGDCPDCQFYVPNAFSPNFDGNNDYFEVFTNCPPLEQEIKIFNRWGELVFASDEAGARWDGLTDPKRTEIGVYTYLIQLTFEEFGVLRKTLLKGEINLIR
jgi:gliding motility-associated-like protein